MEIILRIGSDLSGSQCIKTMKLWFSKFSYCILIFYPRNHQNRLEFGVGDKICCTKNAYLSELLPENTFNSQQNNELKASGEDFNGGTPGFAKNKHDFESGTRLCNGEIFFITAVGDNRKIVPFYL